MNKFSKLKITAAEVHKERVIGPLLYLLYTRDIPQNIGTISAICADYTTIIITEVIVEKASRNLQKSIRRGQYLDKKMETETKQINKLN